MVLFKLRVAIRISDDLIWTVPTQSCLQISFHGDAKALQTIKTHYPGESLPLQPFIRHPASECKKSLWESEKKIPENEPLHAFSGWLRQLGACA